MSKLRRERQSSSPSDLARSSTAERDEGASVGAVPRPLRSRRRQQHQSCDASRDSGSPNHAQAPNAMLPAEDGRAGFY